jgi:hypothetical protein
MQKEHSMRIKQTALILILIGTAGLLGSEFIFHWDRTVTLLLACVSLLGFVLLGARLLLAKGFQGGEKP